MAVSFARCTDNLEWVETNQVSMEEVCVHEPFMVFGHHTGGPGAISQEEIDALLNGDKGDGKRRYYCWCPEHKQYENLVLTGHGLMAEDKSCQPDAKYCCLFSGRPEATSEFFTEEFREFLHRSSNLGQGLKKYFAKSGQKTELLELEDDCFEENDSLEAAIVWHVGKEDTSSVHISTVCQNLSVYYVVTEKIRNCSRQKLLGVYPYRTRYDIYMDMSTGKVNCIVTEWYGRQAAEPGVPRQIEDFPVIIREIPHNVLKLSLLYMAEQAGNVFGFQPEYHIGKIEPQTLQDYLYRPMDWRCCELRKFFGDDFERVIQRTDSNPFVACCTYLGIPPTTGVHNLYLKDVHLLIGYKILQELGFEDINFILKMLDLGRREFLPNLKAGIYQDGAVVIADSDEQQEYFRNLKFYASLLMAHKGKEEVCRRFTKEAKKNFHYDYITQDTLQMIFEYWDRLSENLQRRILEEGINKPVHDALAIAVGEILLDNTIMDYPEDNYSCRINGYTFRLVKQVNLLRMIGERLHNCVVMYARKVKGGGSKIITVDKEGKYVACIEVEDDFFLNQAYGDRNKELSEEMLKMLFCWAGRRNLKLGVYCSYDYYELFRKWRIWEKYFPEEEII